MASTMVVMGLTLFSFTVLSVAQAVGMKALNVYGGQLHPVFSPSTFNYELDLDEEGTLQKQQDFGTLQENLVLPPRGEEKPSVILAPHLDGHEYQDNEPRPRLFIHDREVPCEPRHIEGRASPHVAISRKELLASSFQHAGGRHAYAMILIEVHVPAVTAGVGHSDSAAAAGMAVEFDEGHHVLRYVIRVYGTVSRAAEEAARRKLLAVAQAQAPVVSQLASWRSQPVVVPEGFAEVMKDGSATVAIKLSDGLCVHTTGPFHGIPLVDAPRQAVHLFQAGAPQIVCFANRVDQAADDEDTKFKFVAARFGGAAPQEQLGQFGFGQNMKVALRPEIATDAVWPLQEGVQSLGVPLDGDTFRVIGLRSQNEVGQQIDLPVVMTRLRQDWPIDVQFVNSSVGSCKANPGPDRLFRFVCRTEQDIPEDTPAQLIAFCPACRKQELGKHALMMNVDSIATKLDLEGGGGTGSARQTSTSLQVTSSWTSSTGGKPWAAWTAEAPGYGSQKQWELRVSPAGPHKLHSRAPRRHEGGSASDEPIVFEVIIASAATTLAFEGVTLTSAEKDKLHNAGTMMSQATLVIVTLLSCSALATFVLGLPNRLLAALPSLSAAALSLQFLALAGNLPSAPEPLRALAGPLAWLANGTPKSTFTWSLFILFAVGIAHLAAVCKFIIYNGRGSASALPHGFALGGWELRALGLLTFPLAASSAHYVVPLLAESARHPFWFFAMIPPGIVLLVLIFLAFGTWRAVTQAISDDQVVLITLPPAVGSKQETGYPVFTDHFCDQLRSIPSDAGSSSLLGDWLATPSFCLKPEVASIHIVEHRGARLFKPSMFQWCSQYDSGPWRAHQLRQQVEDEQSQDTSVVKLPSDYTLYKLGIKQAPSATNAETVFAEINAEVNALHRDRGSTASTCTAALWGNSTTSELVMHHPIGVKTKFAYQGSVMAGGTVAGVRCLPWINCAVPAATLMKLESHLQGEVALRTQVGQMSGPVSGGRLAACFDWGVLWPWNCPADIALKIVLGIWVALLPHTAELSPTKIYILNAVTVVATIAYVWAGVVFRPYVHILDVLSAVAARVAVALTVGASIMVTAPSDSAFIAGAWGSFVPTLMTVAGLTLVPLFVLLIASYVLTKSMVGDIACKGCSQGNKAAEELLEKFWKETGDSDDQIDLGKHMIDVVFQDMHPAPRLPALVRSPVEHIRLQPCPGRRGTCTQLPSNGKPWLSLVPSLLFPLTGNRGSTVSRGAAPIAALTEMPDDGRLLFPERNQNGGLEWREVLHSFIDPIDEDCANEAESLIQAYEFPLEGAGADRSMVIIELLPASDSTPGNLIR